MMRIKNLSNELKFRGLIYFIFFTWNLYQVINHEMWRDEAHSWLIAYHATAPQELLSMTRYEGRQPLWYFILWIFNQITDDFEAAKVITLLFNFFTLLILIFFSKLDLKILVLILCGFLFTGGYTALLRDYAVELCLLSLLIMLKRRQAPRHLLFFVAGILAFVNAFGLVISISVIIAEFLTDLRKTLDLKEKKQLLSIVFFCFSVISSIYFIKPPKDNSFQLIFEMDLYKNFSAIYFKNTVSLFPFMSSIEPRTILFFTVALLSSIIIFLFLWINWKYDKYIFWFSTMGILLFSLNYIFGYAHYWWHFGHLFLIFLISSLISQKPVDFNNFLKFRNTIMMILLISQIVSNFGYPGNTLFSKQPYSNASEAADFIKDSCLSQCTLLTNNLVLSEGISAYLDGQVLFNVKTNSFESFTIWGNNDVPEDNWQAIVRSAKHFENPIVIVTGLTQPPNELKLLKKLDSAKISDEQFEIYTLR